MTGLTVEFAGKEHTIVGVFYNVEAVVLIPAIDGFTAAELFPAPDGTDLYRYARNCATQADLEEPAQILCGPESASIALLLPWLCVILYGWPLLRRTTYGRSWRLLIILLLLMPTIPNWLLPTRCSDTVFWSELLQSLSSRFHDWISLSPTLRDLPVKECWLTLGGAMLIVCGLSKDLCRH